jgi:oxygen-independent coproporphyrinogen-3 oxidase
MAGIYIHIPFCKGFCNYCDFYSITDNSEAESFVQAVLLETAMQARYLDGETVETVYLGGGTPSLLTAGQTRQIISAVRNNFTVSDDPEITVEVNPDDVYEDISGTGRRRH